MKKPASGKLQLRLPPELHAKVRKLSARDGLSLNKWINAAVVEKASKA